MKKKHLKNKKILITGGAGFIGSNLCEKLLEYGSFVRCLDNFSTGKKSNIKNFISNENFELIEGDITNYEICDLSCKNIDYVLHHAARGSVPKSIENPRLTNEINVGGFINVLEAANKNMVKRFIYASSSSVYGDSPELPKVEDKIGKPLSPYAVSKYINELYAKNFNFNYGIDTIGLRYFNVFGKNQDPKGAYAAVIPKFIDCFLNLEPPTINGDGCNSRDFTYVENVIDANIQSILTENKNALNQVYNIACGKRINLNELADLIKKNLTFKVNKIKNINVQHGAEREGDVLHSLASIEKAKSLLNYNPIVSFTDGLNKTITWYFESS